MMSLRKRLPFVIRTQLLSLGIHVPLTAVPSDFLVVLMGDR